MIRIRRSRLDMLLNALNAQYKIFIDPLEQYVFKEIAERQMKETLFELALLDIPVDRISNSLDEFVVVRTHYGMIIPEEQEAYLAKINVLYTQTLADPIKNPEFVIHKKRLLEKEVALANKVGLDIILKEPIGYVFKDEYIGLSMFKGRINEE